MSVITQAERVFIDRRRRGETQKAAAKRHGVPFRQYLGCERGTITCKLKIPPLGRLHSHERCVLARRRAGLTQRQVAERTGHCRRWIIMMERGEVSSKTLEEFWSE